MAKPSTALTQRRGCAGAHFLNPMAKLARRSVLAGALALLPLMAVAAPVPWRSNAVDYSADHKDLKEVLRDVTASAGVPVWISQKVQGSVSGNFKTSPQRLLDRMSASFGFVWYYDGSVLRIYASDELTSTTLGLTSATTAQLRRSLNQLAVTDPRFPLRFDDEARTVVVSGPPRYVELIADVARLVDQNHQTAQHGMVVRSFPLHYAWASDHTVSVDGQSITIQGVANILRGLYTPGGTAITSQTAPQASAHRLHNVADADGGGPSGGSRRRPPVPNQQQPEAGQSTNNWTIGLPGLVGDNSAAASSDDSDDDSDDTPVAPAPKSKRRGGRGVNIGEDIPVIQPDPRTNSILIRGRPDRMAAFASLIASLDTRPAVLEIDASIIEITDNALEQIGVDWRLHNSHVDFELGSGNSAQAGYPDSLNPQGFTNPNTTTAATAANVIAGTPAGGVFTAVLGGAGHYLLSRVSALQQTDQATLNASPKVATLDNVEAIMDNKQTFYVPVSGYQSADLYSISAGVSLRVLPMIVRNEDGSHIRLNVHIDDGQITQQTVGQLPVVNNSTIDTQALIAEGESLLIAGYQVDETEKGSTGVPLLSKIPLIGGLFRYNSNSGKKFQRLFLVTPRILTPPGADVATSN